MITDAEWLRILCDLGVRPTTASKWNKAFADEVQEDRFSAGKADLVCFLPQMLHEYALLERTEESLIYNPERICAVWPSRFPNTAAAVPYAFAPQKLANFVYGGRMGNCEPNDGWTFRGRPMLTGRATYARVGDLIGQDLIDLPDLIQQPHYALIALIAWWEDQIPDACLNDQTKIRRRVQGGTLGLEHCMALHLKTQELFA